MATQAILAGRQYPYGYGRIGVLQEYLLTENAIERLVSADATEFVQLLTELKIAKSIDWTNNPHELVRELERWLQRETTELVPEPDRYIFDILWLRSDASYLSYLLKANRGYTSSESTAPHVTATAFNPDDLCALAQGENASSAPSELVKFVASVRQNVALTPPEIDAAVTRFIALRQSELAARSGSRLIQQYTAHHLDLQNIHIARRLGENDKPEKHLLPGGRIPLPAFTADPVVLAQVVQSSSLPNGLAEALLDGGNESSVLLQRALAKAIARDIALMRDCVLTIEPLFAFAAVAQSQFKVLRTVVVGKLARLSVADVRRMLPPFLSTSPFID